MIDLEFLRHLDKLSLIINKRVTSNYVGERQSEFAGEGLLFKDHRIYAPGDDIKNIDWRVYARTDDLFVRKFEAERNLTVHVVLDMSASMDFGKPFKKSSYSGMLAMGFAYMALKNNEKFVISTFSDKLEVFKAQKGKGQLMKVFDYLNKKRPIGTSKLGVSLSKYKKFVDSKSLIVIVSDFLYDIEEIKNVLYRFKRNDVKLIQVLDKTESKLNIEGDYKLKDLETSSILRTFIGPFLRKRYFTKLEEHQHNIKEACAETGAKFYAVSTEKPIFDVFYDILR
ncbi:MAG: DUF58 domain-containing protein [Candidatus Nanoarchaeia archaeon]|nr:DUF58 domain-containing protein [Candidatus Nanoarchaeia archaeon]